MDNYNLHILGEAKNEYTRQLVNVLTPRILEGIRSIYESAREVCDKHGDEQYLKKFQALLAQIPKWTNDILDKEWNRIMRKSDCDWLDELLRAVFVSHTKVLMAIKSVKKHKGTIDVDVPTGSHFLHQVYLETARSFWKRPYLMYHRNPSIEVQKNLYESELIIGNAVNETIRKMMPVKNILRDYLGNDYRDDDLDDIDEDILSQKTKNNLRKLVKEEIEQTLSHGSYGKRQRGGSEDSGEVKDEKINSDTVSEVVSEDKREEVERNLEETQPETQPETYSEQINEEVERTNEELPEKEEEREERHMDEGERIETESKDTLLEQINNIEKELDIQETIPETTEIQDAPETTETTETNEENDRKGNSEVMDTIKRIELEIVKNPVKKVEMVVRKDDNETIKEIVEEKMERTAEKYRDEDNFSFFEDAAPF